MGGEFAGRGGDWSDTWAHDGKEMAVNGSAKTVRSVLLTGVFKGRTSGVAAIGTTMGVSNITDGGVAGFANTALADADFYPYGAAATKARMNASAPWGTLFILPKKYLFHVVRDASEGVFGTRGAVATLSRIGEEATSKISNGWFTPYALEDGASR